MDKPEKYLIFAHYHSSGLIRKDLLNFLINISEKFQHIIFVSTNLKKKERLKIPKNIKTIIRKNTGYDFYSYKIGFEYFFKKSKDELNFKNFFFINSSILFVKPNKLINAISSIKINKQELWGLTKSLELSEHIGSYFFCFSATIFNNKEILRWWSRIKALKKRQDIIFTYELGLSDLMIKNNVKLLSLFKKNLNLLSKNIFEKIKQRYKEIFFKEIKLYKKNPLHYFWEDIYNQFGIIKIELIKKNPENLNLTKVRYILKVNGNLEMEAINN